MLNHFKPQPGRFGTELITLVCGPIGPADYLGGAAPLTANATTTFRLGPVPRKCVFARLAASATTVPADADGTIVATAFKYDAATNAQVQISGAINLETLITREGSTANQYSSATEAGLTLQVGDTVEVNVVNNSAGIDTQPAGLVFVAELYVLE
jgi:hypothetical protein